MKFHASSLADIAEHFRANAEGVRSRARAAAQRSQQRKMLEAQASTWEQAAGIIEVTELATPRRRGKVAE